MASTEKVGGRVNMSSPTDSAFGHAVNPQPPTTAWFEAAGVLAAQQIG